MSNANLVGLLIMVATTLIAILSIRLNAVVTGLFLAIELLAVGTMTVLGFAHIHQPLSILFMPQTIDAQGVASPLPFGLLLAGVSIAIYAYNGYDAPIVYSEEMTGPRHGVARAVFWALGITIAAELIPVTAALLGAPSLQGLQRFAEALS
jgi:amino acid transporter